VANLAAAMAATAASPASAAASEAASAVEAATDAAAVEAAGVYAFMSLRTTGSNETENSLHLRGERTHLTVFMFVAWAFEFMSLFIFSL
jgi:hypothetical protein